MHKKLTDYAAILDYNMEKAYNLVHKDRILVYSLEGMRIKDEDFDKKIQETPKKKKGS